MKVQIPFNTSLWTLRDRNINEIKILNNWGEGKIFYPNFATHTIKKVEVFEKSTRKVKVTLHCGTELRFNEETGLNKSRKYKLILECDEADPI